jgi:hypothetical protein
VVQLSQRYYGAGKSVMDYQVIVPMKERGLCSAKNLNKALQDIFNKKTVNI